MLRYKTKTRPGLVALYDIRPENGAGPFLQPRSPHGATHNADCTRSVQCHVQALQDHDTVINVTDAVVAGTEKFSEVAGMKRETARR